MKYLIQSVFSLLILIAVTSSVTAQKLDVNKNDSSTEIDFSDRQAIHEAIKNFFIGDHTGSIKHKKLSMNEKGAYRYINRDGKYSESVFQLDSDDSDMSYKEELLSIEIYDKLALARVRLQQFKSEDPDYKLMTLHKADDGWKITSITWGFGITY